VDSEKNVKDILDRTEHKYWNFYTKKGNIEIKTEEWLENQSGLLKTKEKR